MKKEIEIQMQLKKKWTGNHLSIAEAIEYCELAILSYSKSNTFDDKASARQYTFCQKMLDLARINDGCLVEVLNNKKGYVTFKLAFDKPKSYSHFDKMFVDYTKSCGYMHPEDSD